MRSVCGRDYCEYEEAHAKLLELLDASRLVGVSAPGRTGIDILELLIAIGPLTQKELSQRLNRSVRDAAHRLISGLGLVCYDYSQSKRGLRIWVRDPEHFRQIKRNESLPRRMPCTCRDCVSADTPLRRCAIARAGCECGGGRSSRGLYLPCRSAG